MKTAVMFAGVDALDLSEQRLSMAGQPEVVARIQQAQKFLDIISPKKIDLLGFLLGDEQAFHDDLPLKAFVCAISQVGLYDQYLKRHGEPDYLVGCSLGDTARTVCSGAVTFEEMVYGTYLFNSVGQTIQGGMIVRARTNKGVLSNEQVREIEARGLTLAVYQTPKHFLVSGPEQELRAWVSEVTASKLYSIKPLYDKPLHSKGMTPALSAVKEAFANANAKPWKVGIVSSVHQKMVVGEAELRSDIEDNMTSTVYWWQTFKWMAEKLDVSKFVNIGPVPTLMLFADRIPLHVPITLEDSLKGFYKVIEVEPQHPRELYAQSSV